MNDEREHTEMQRLVSETYRQATKERAPEHLSKSIIQRAADALATPPQRSANAFSATWIRPAAWVAAISLSLAIVLEVTQGRLPEQPVTMVTTTAPAAIAVPRVLEKPAGKGGFEAQLPSAHKMGAPAAMAETQASDATDACDSESRDTAAAWFACIRGLRATGQTADADSEHDEFILKFPDFVPH